MQTIPQYLFPLTLGEARVWARRFRKLGLSPVTIHHVEASPIGRTPSGYRLHCHWPFDVAALPEDLREFLERDYDGIPWDYDGLTWVATRHMAERIYWTFAAVRLGRGSRPLPLPPTDHSHGGNVVSLDRLAWGRDDWPGTQRHPDWERYLRDTNGPLLP
jgi:hypothetical protein